MNNFFSSLVAATIAAAVAFVSSGFNPVASAIAFTATFFVSYFYPRPEQAVMKPASLADFSVSQCNEGQPIPIVYGTVRIPANIIWYGNLKSVEVKENVGDGKNSEEVTVGYNYYIDCWQVIAKGKIAIEGVYSNEREITKKEILTLPISNPPEWSETVVYEVGDIVGVPTSFGIRPYYCKKRNIGVNPVQDASVVYPFNGEYWVGATVYSTSQATFDVRWATEITVSGKYSNILKSKYVIFNDGRSEDTPSSLDTNVSNWIETTLPSVSHVFLKEFFVGRSTTFLPTLTFKVRRILSDDVPLPYADMDTGSNPAAIIYDLLVNELKINSSYIDISSFSDLSNYFYENNMGINYVISSTTKLTDEINKILSYVNSFLYITEEGKIAIKKIDNDDASVGIIDKVLSVSMSKPTVSSLPNIFVGNYVDNGVVHTVKTENSANIKYAGTKNVKTVDLSVFSSEEVALKVINDVMTKESYPFSSLSITVPIQYSMYNCGDVITLQLEDEGIYGDFRIVEKREDDIKKGTVSYSLVQHRVVNLSEIEDLYPQFNSSYVEQGNIYVINSSDVKIYESNESTIDGKLKVYVLVGGNENSSNTFSVFTTDLNDNITYKGTLEYSGVYELLEDMPVSKFDIDDEIILKVKPIVRNYNLEYSLDRSNLFSDNRIAIIGNEIIKIQSIDTTNPDEILLKGFIRGFKNTPNEMHYAGDKLYLTTSYNFITIDANVESVVGLYLQDKLVSEYNTEDKVSMYDGSGVSLIEGCYAEVQYTPSNIYKIPYKPTSCVVNEDNNCLDVFVVSKVKGAGRVNPDNSTDIYPFEYENKVNYKSESGSVSIDDVPNSSEVVNLIDCDYINIKAKNEVYYSNPIYKIYIKGGISSFSDSYTVEVVNNDNVLYKDVVIPIYLDSTKIDFNLFLKSSYNDIVPYNERFGFLDYWIEKIDVTNEIILMHVKIPYVYPLGVFKFNLYIGNSNFNSYLYGNPYSVFEYFEDFSVFTGWNIYGSGEVSQDLTTFGFPTLKKSSYGDPNGGYKNIGNVFSRLNNSFTVLAKINRTYLSGANADRIGFIDDNGNGYGLILDHTYDRFGYDIRTNFAATYTIGFTGFDIVNDWYKGEIRYNKGYIKILCSDDLFINVKECEFEDYTHNYFNNIYVFGGYTYFIDYIAIKRFYKNNFIINIY